ncbi:Glycosyl transferase family 2 [Sulfitobacter marinus]|uniref:Glycosyl transferase family 2 n=1 Tax=Sulfitobacter marinus TaxID=394264 RepID=A0A1I6VTX2_9RHOB|nr:glycosyltransferase family 2 protein [Sulfitobacter marinus]SFT17127.1 Glycosyl transferase family 2 [Sulfitobacter marinus]
MKLIISHFFNEEYLLPWWLKHHRVLFDHGVLIDYHSTDRSIEICRELVPNWEIISSENKNFSALACDFEVMKHEDRFPGAWKIALNTTEFLVGKHLDKIIERAETGNYLGASIPGTAMVDDNPEVTLDLNVPLVAQKFHGFWESEFPLERVNFPWYFPRARTRLLHRHRFGAYTPGRHSSMLTPLMDISKKELGIWWYGYSPWTAEFVARKAQIQTKMDPLDKEVGRGLQHLANDQEQQMRRKVLLDYAHDLTLPGEQAERENYSKAQYLDAQHAAIAERDAAIAERDAAIAERDAAIAEREQAKRYPWKHFGNAYRMRSKKKLSDH